MALLGMPKTVRWGYAYVMLAAVFWAVSGASAKFLFQSGLSPLELVQLRVTLGTMALMLWLGGRRPHLFRIHPRDIFYFLVLGTFGMAAVQYTYLFAISKIHVAAAILLQYLAPVFIALYTVVIAREKLMPATLVALAGAVGGIFLVVGAYNLDLLALNRAGTISGLLSALSFAWYTVHGEYGMRRYNPWTVLFYALLFSALIWNLLFPPLEAFRHSYGLAQWGWILYIAVLGTVVPYGLFLEGINLIRSTRASITATLEPITAGVLAAVFLGEYFEWPQVLGGALVVAAIILLQVRQPADETAPHFVRHGRDPGNAP